MPAALLLYAAVLSWSLTGAAHAQTPVPDTLQSNLTPTRWPACGWHVVDDTTATRLRRVFEVRESLKGVSAEKIAATHLLWRQVDSPLLSRLMPNTRWYLVDAYSDGTFIGMTPCYPIAVRGDSSYPFWELDKLLVAVGKPRDTCRYQEVAQVAVLSVLLDESATRFERRPSLRIEYTAENFLPWGWTRRSGTSRVALGEDRDSAMVAAQRMADSANEQHRLDSVALTHSIPPVEFGLATRQSRGLETEGMTLVDIPFAADGRQRTLSLVFNKGRLSALKENGRPVMTFASDSAGP